MASILDQYEQASSRSGGHHSHQVMPEPINTGFINARFEDDTPIFNKQRINFNPPDPITHLVVCNNYLVMAMSSNILLRIDLEHPDTPDEVELPRGVEDRVYNMFLDPTGRHLVISMMSTENYYLSRNSRKAKSLGKFKGHQISAVGWNMQSNSDTSTGEILIGTTKGFIFETEIVSGEDSRFFQASLEQYVKQLFNLGLERPTPVTGLEFERMPSQNLTEYRYFVLATTPGRLYQFVGTIPTSTEPPMFSHIFSKYEDKDIPERFLEIPGEFGDSVLQLYYPKYRQPPRKFAWMTGPGIYYGNIDISEAPEGHDNVTADSKLMLYPGEDVDRGINPKTIVLTEFHVLVLFPERLKAMCVLNEQLVFDDTFTDRYGKLVGMCKDPLRGSIWAFTSHAVFKYKIIRESRDVWQMYLDKEQFDLAKLYCRDNPAHMDKVYTKEAEHFFKIGNYQKAAEMFAQTQNSFEEVALKFIRLQEKEALKTFLLKKLAGLRPQDKTQVTMLVMWLIEIYLNQLGVLKEQGEDMDQKYDRLQEEFRKYLNQPRVKECVSDNKATVYELIASHGDVEDMVFFAVLMQDFEKVINHHLQHDSHKSALDVLAKQHDMELFYKFSPILMQNVPNDTVDAWINKGKQLDPKRLIPAIVQYDHAKQRTQTNDAIRYLEFAIQMLDNRDQAIHNYLLSLYAKLQPDQLMKYLNFQGQDPDSICYDLKYALRLCAEHKHKRACVHIYSTMGLYEEAVDLALQVDVELAKHNADKPEDDEELRKRLWLRIARHVVEEEKDIKRAMEFLHECDLLKIEDILPFFPDFVTIDHFKDAICTSLQEYNQHIESLKEEMEEATESAKEIRAEIQAFRNKYAFVKSGDKCSSCGFPLMTRGFYVFPCGHKFHNDCLVSEVVPHLSGTKRARVEDLQRKLVAKDHTVAAALSTAVSASPLHRPQLHRVKEELDDLIAAECVYCGEIMIRCIDQPFIEEEEYEDTVKSWL